LVKIWSNSKTKGKYEAKTLARSKFIIHNTQNQKVIIYLSDFSAKKKTSKNGINLNLGYCKKISVKLR